MRIGACADEPDVPCFPDVAAEVRNNLFLNADMVHPEASGSIGFTVDYLIPGEVSVTNNIFKDSWQQDLYIHGGSANGNIFTNSAPKLDIGRMSEWQNNTIYRDRDGLTMEGRNWDNLPSLVGATGNRYYSSRDIPAHFAVPGMGTGVFDIWQGVTGDTGNANAFSLPDPAVTLADYHASIGGVASTQAFFDEALLQRKFNYRQEYSAEAVISHFRAALMLDGFGQIFSDGFETGDTGTWSTDVH